MFKHLKEIGIYLGDWITSKLILLLAWIVVYFAPLVPFMLIVTAFVALDYLTGIQASKKKNIPITSKRRKDTVTKTLAYQATLMTAYLVERSFLPMFPILKLTAGFLAYVEVTSIDENIKIVTGKSFLKEILKKFPKFNSK
jgi:phosphatidylglycerophosphate synthase